MTVDIMKLEREADKYIQLFSVKDRLDIRLPKFQKELFEKVATIQGVSLTDFIIKSAIDAAADELEKVKNITFSINGQRAFVEALDQPREFSESIKDRYVKYSKLREKGRASEEKRRDESWPSGTR